VVPLPRVFHAPACVASAQEEAPAFVLAKRRSALQGNLGWATWAGLHVDVALQVSAVLSDLVQQGMRLCKHLIAVVKHISGILCQSF
jgi:hypothetical protein